MQAIDDSGDVRPVRLEFRDWIYLTVAIVAACVTNVGALYGSATAIRADMLEMDRRWQTRSESMSAEIAANIPSVPRLFEEIVARQGVQIEYQSDRIVELEKQVLLLKQNK